MRRLAPVLFLSLALVIRVFAAGNQTINTIPSTSTPSSAATFATDLAVFLQREDAARQAELFPTGKVLPTGGLHGPSASMTSPAFATIAYTTSGNRVQQAATSINYGTLGCAATTTAWVIASASATSPMAGFVRSAGSVYFVDCQTAGTPPLLPADSVWLMQVSLAGSQITSVADLRPLSLATLQEVGGTINPTQPPYNVPSDGNGDAAPGINQALVDAVNTGSSVVLPCGTYRILAPIVLQSSGQLSGIDRACTVIAPATTVTIPQVLTATNVTHLTVRDLQVDCGDATLARTGIVGLNATSDMMVEHVWVRRCGRAGIAFQDTSTQPFSSGGGQLVWRDNVVDMAGIPGGSCIGTSGLFYFPRGAAGYLAGPGPLIEGNTIFATSADRGIQVLNSQGPRIGKNYVSGPDCTGVGSLGVAIVALYNQDTVITGNTLNGMVRGILFGAGVIANVNGGNQLRSVRTLIQGNTLRFFTQGILATDAVTAVQIDNNQLARDGATATDGIALTPETTNFTNVSITNNTVDGAINSIALRSSADQLYGYDNLHVQGNMLSSTQLNGVAIFADRAPYSSITGNNITGHLRGIDVQSAGSGSGGVLVDVSHNMIRDINATNAASQACITLQNTTNARIASNSCINSSGSAHAKYGLTLDAATMPFLANNVWSGMEVGDLGLFNIVAQPSPTPTPQQLYIDQNSTQGPGNTAENTLSVIQLPRSYFTSIGGVTILAIGETFGVGGTKAIKVYFAGSQLGTTLTMPTGTLGYRLEGDVWIPESPPTSQHTWLKGYNGNSLLTSDYRTLGIDTTSAVIQVAVTCQMVSAGDICRSRGLVVKPWR